MISIATAKTFEEVKVPKDLIPITFALTNIDGTPQLIPYEFTYDDGSDLSKYCKKL